jgi:hypothetical protein
MVLLQMRIIVSHNPPVTTIQKGFDGGQNGSVKHPQALRKQTDARPRNP